MKRGLELNDGDLDVDEDEDEGEDGGLGKKKKKSKKSKKIKRSLPLFASYDDYERMVEDERGLE